MRFAAAALLLCPALAFAQSFQVEEATIEAHIAPSSGARRRAARSSRPTSSARGPTTASCTQLVTRDGAPVAAGAGAVRAGRAAVVSDATRWPSTRCCRTSRSTRALPIELRPHGSARSRIRTCSSSTAWSSASRRRPGQRAQHAQSSRRALGDVQSRVRRAPVVRRRCRRAAPPACEEFRQQPDALERAAELDAQYGSNPDLEAMPMYCVAFSFKDVFDTSDMRSTGGADVNYAMDARARGFDHRRRAAREGRHHLREGEPVRVQRRQRQSRRRAKATTRDVRRRRPQLVGRHGLQPLRHDARDRRIELRIGGLGRREPGQCSICEETGGSCRQPAWRNGVVALVTTKGLMPYGGAIGADPYLDRAGIHCRTVQGHGAACSTRLQRSEARLLRSARHLHARCRKALVAEGAVRLVRRSAGRAPGSQAAGRRAHRHRARVHGASTAPTTRR